MRAAFTRRVRSVEDIIGLSQMGRKATCRTSGSSNSLMDCHLRPASESDRDFLYALFCITMREVIDQTWGWDESWQRSDFQRRFTEHIVSMIEVDGRAVGAVWLEWKLDSVFVHELQVVPEMQGNGIGTAVITKVILQAAERGLPVTLSVVSANPRATRLYERLGFEVDGVSPPFIHMRHRGLSG